MNREEARYFALVAHMMEAYAMETNRPDSVERFAVLAAELKTNHALWHDEELNRLRSRYVDRNWETP